LTEQYCINEFETQNEYKGFVFEKLRKFAKLSLKFCGKELN